MKVTAQTFKRNSGFTLIELLVVIGILAILLSIVLIAINPARQFGQANNTQRRSNATAILNAIGAYSADHHGVLPGGTGATAIDTTDKTISSTGADLCADLVPNYISALPTDPSLNIAAVGPCPVAPATYDTAYHVTRDANNRVTVSAPSAENGETITITR